MTDRRRSALAAGRSSGAPTAGRWLRPLADGCLRVLVVAVTVGALLTARAALMPDEAFLEHDDGCSDAVLAERFDVPLDQVEAKRYDLAFLRPPSR
jgi:hypothetical protein